MQQLLSCIILFSVAMQGSKYGLQIRAPKSHQKQQQARPLVPKPLGFTDDDGNDNNVEHDISRQAAKNKSHKDVEEQYKKALEEDPSVFDYDGVYDDMKAKIVQPKAQDREQRQPKYIQVLMEKAKRREKEHEIVYERKLAKERTKEDHLYADKDKFVTNAYKRKLAEQARWMEEERLRELREERDDVTKKSDITDFYFNLSKNVAYGASGNSKKQVREEKELAAAKEDLQKPEKPEKEPELNTRLGEHSSTSSAAVAPLRVEDKCQQGEASAISPGSTAKPAPSLRNPSEKNTPSSDKPKQDHHKKSEDAIAAAKERFLARKKAKMQ